MTHTTKQLRATRAYELAADRALETGRPRTFTLDGFSLIAIPERWALDYAAIKGLGPLPPAPSMMFADGRKVSFWRDPQGKGTEDRNAES